MGAGGGLNKLWVEDEEWVKGGSGEEEKGKVEVGGWVEVVEAVERRVRTGEEAVGGR